LTRVQLAALKLARALKESYDNVRARGTRAGLREPEPFEGLPTNGYEACRRMRAGKGSDARIVALTGRDRTRIVDGPPRPHPMLT
jgi:hypothetical protein